MPWLLSPKHKGLIAICLELLPKFSLLGSDHPPYLGILETRSLPVSLVEPALPLLLISVLAVVWIIQKASVMCLTSHNYAAWGWWDVLSLTHSEFRGDSLIHLHFSHGTHQRNGSSPPNSSIWVFMQEGPFPLLL